MGGRRSRTPAWATNMRSIPRFVLLSGTRMRLSFAFFAAIMMLLSLVGAQGAQAAVPCEPPSTEAALHFAGDADEVPNCPSNGSSHHHHSSCGGHQLAASEPAARMQVLRAVRMQLAGTSKFLLPGLRPDSEPEPPKA